MQQILTIKCSLHSLGLYPSDLGSRMDAGWETGRRDVYADTVKQKPASHVPETLCVLWSQVANLTNRHWSLWEILMN